MLISLCQSTHGAEKNSRKEGGEKKSLNESVTQAIATCEPLQAVSWTLETHMILERGTKLVTALPLKMAQYHLFQKLEKFCTH